MIQFILGGVRSGKSKIAEQLASELKIPVTYIATAKALDIEMAKRIDQHKKYRDKQWATIEEPIQLAKAISELNTSGHCILIECLTLWLTNLLMLEDSEILNAELEHFIEQLKATNTDVIIVSNESNMGIIPLDSITRQYCDAIGILHQQIASLSDRVILTVAGLPHTLKGEKHAL